MSKISTSQLVSGVFPLAVVGMVIIMMVPLPAFILDCLLMANIALAVVLLLAVIYTVESERLTSLPTLLLLATLFRLGINVSTTRQLLAEGVAPSTISAFGNFVVHGNLAVGAVVFAIITLVQFLVIAKGSERVAEVAARFALDAMPGKQMSIDADVRCGILSLAEAKVRRERLQRESKLYGSLDGAMKFVKGDAIAGLCITIVNVLGGLFVGAFQHGLSLVDALQRFTLFAIGDGLASQIPALLIAVAAGVAVTRVSGDRGLHLADDVREQLTSEPQVLISSGVIVFLVGCMPGLYGLPFWITSLLLIGAGAQKNLLDRERAAVSNQEVFRPTIVPGLLLCLSPAATEKLQEQGTLPAKAQALRAELFENTGIYLQDIQFEIEAKWQELRVELRYQGETIEAYSCSIEDGQSSIAGEIASWVLDSIANFVNARRCELMDDTQVRLLFEIHRSTCDDVINSLVPSKLSITEVTTVLRELTREQVNIRNFSRVLQALAEAEFGVSETSRGDAGALLPALSPQQRRVSAVRKALRRSICDVLLERETLVVSLIEPALDSILSDRAKLGGSIDPRLEAILSQVIQAQIDASSRLIVISSTPARFTLRDCFQRYFPKLVLLSAEEVDPEISLRIAGTIGSDGYVEDAEKFDRLEKYDEDASVLALQ